MFARMNCGALDRFHPFPELDVTRRAVDQLLRDFWCDSSTGGSFLPALDIHETDEELILRADLPGVKKDDLEIVVENGVLTLRGQRSVERGDGARLHRAERAAGKFARAVTLPADVDDGKVRATYSDGVLELRLPKRAEVRPRRIPIA